jgi:hypothetical protein
MEVERGFLVKLTTKPPSVGHLPRKYGILNISESYRHPRPVTGMVFLYFS